MEYINKAELIKECEYTVCLEDDEETFGISEAMIDLMPTIDIVHCNDCKYFCTDDGLYCSELLRETRADWFCADGEKR